MPINIIERAVTPYNSSPNSLVNKEQYSVYAPGADIGKPGMAGFSAEFFAVAQQIVSLSNRFLQSIVRVRQYLDQDTRLPKDANTLYTPFTDTVVVAYAADHTPQYGSKTGNLFVFHRDLNAEGRHLQTEFLYTVDGLWSRELTVQDNVVVEVTDFVPLHGLLIDGSVTTDKLVDGSVTTDKLVDGSVTTDKLADESVTTDKIGHAVVTGAKIKDGAVTSEKIDPGAVGTSKLANESVTGEKIAGFSVTADKICPGAIDESKLDPSLIDQFDGNYVETDEFDRLKKEVANLRAGIPSDKFIVDEMIAYRKNVPSEALPFAELKEIGGITYADKNLFDAKNLKSYFGYSMNHISVSKDCRIISVNGDPNGDYNSLDLVLEAGVTYCATYGGTGTLYYVPAAAALTEIKSGVPFTVSGSINCLAFGANGGTFTNLMIVKGNTPADFAPYIEGGMASAAVTEIETVGYNILDLTPALNANLTDNGDGTYTLTRTANGRFSEFFPLYIPKGQEVFCYLEIVSTNIDGLTRIPLQLFGADKNDNRASIGIVNGGAAYAPQAATFFAKAYLQVNDAEGAYATFRSPMIKYGKSAEFSPYSKHTYPIPAEVQALDGWGMGVNETYHNRLDWTKKQYRQEVGTVDMGDLTYSMRVSRGRNIFGTSSLYQTIRGFVAGDAPLPAVAVGYRAVRVTDTWVDGDMAYGNSVEGYTSIEFVNNAYTDAASFKEAMRGRKLVYALASPTVTDLPELPDDNFIEVSGGGTITALNEHALAAPTKIEYQLKEAVV